MPTQLAWNQLPTWLKIILFPVLFVAAFWTAVITITTFSLLTSGVVYAINAVSKKLRNAPRAIEAT